MTYHEGNVLVAVEEGKWRVTGIVDVENAVSALPLLDIAKTDYYAIKANEATRGLSCRVRTATDQLARTSRTVQALSCPRPMGLFATIGNKAAVVRLTEDIRRFAAA
jgi:hygromycin-B 7''-O-kinase